MNSALDNGYYLPERVTCTAGELGFCCLLDRVREACGVPRVPTLFCLRPSIIPRVPSRASHGADGDDGCCGYMTYEMMSVRR